MTLDVIGGIIVFAIIILWFLYHFIDEHYYPKVRIMPYPQVILMPDSVVPTTKYYDKSSRKPTRFSRGSMSKKEEKLHK